MDAESLALVEEYADMIQIGARNMQNFSLLRAAGRAHKPILLKRGIAATLDEFLMAAEYIMSEGNYQVALCERGIRTFTDHTRNTLDLSVVPAAQRLSHLPILVDPSHGTGKRNKVIPLARAAVAVGADGLDDRGASPAGEGAFRRNAIHLSGAAHAGLRAASAHCRGGRAQHARGCRSVESAGGRFLMSSIWPASFEQFRAAAASGNCVPVVRTVPAELITPLAAYLRVARGTGSPAGAAFAPAGVNSRYSFLLESVEGGEQLARYSFLGANPEAVIRSRGNSTRVSSADGSERTLPINAVEYLRECFRSRVLTGDYTGAPFAGGAVGFLSYGAAKWFEPVLGSYGLRS